MFEIKAEEDDLRRQGFTPEEIADTIADGDRGDEDEDGADEDEDGE